MRYYVLGHVTYTYELLCFELFTYSLFLSVSITFSQLPYVNIEIRTFCWCIHICPFFRMFQEVNIAEIMFERIQPKFILVPTFRDEFVTFIDD